MELFVIFLYIHKKIEGFYNLNMQQPKILVAIRKRPLSKKEEGKGDTDIISVKNQETVIVS